MQLFLLIGILKLIFLSDIITLGSSLNYCEDKTSCDQCIGLPGCTWCQDLSYSNPRCYQSNRQNNCTAANKVTVKSSEPIKTKNEPISLTMRINPQQVEVRLAVGHESKVKLDYKDDTDKQLDLYYIMDLSATMENDRDTVSTQAINLVRALQGITSDVRLGFGAFIDKPVLPFVSSSQLRDTSSKYAIPYGFKNWLKLTDDTKTFANVVKNARISRNLDEPEGTLDALMQAVVCTKEIGWRNSSRKLIVVATDGPFHIAGDGKLGGIIRPNDRKCHLSSEGLYTHSTLLDYPSIGEMNAVILEHQVYVIFAISTKEGNNDVSKVYNELQKHISESTATELHEDSSNVVQTIKKKYEEISQTVKLSIAEKPDFVDVKVAVKCPGTNAYIYGESCSKVKQGAPVAFQIGLTLKECPDPKNNPTNNQVVVSFFELSARERLVIKMKYECSCNCSRQYNNNPNDLTKHCNGPEATKHISCGLCTCQETRYGDKCQCTKGEEDDNQDKSKCIHVEGDTTIICSNKGKCKCGQCDCDEDKNGLVMYNGDRCEHSTENCKNPRSPHHLCSGRGKCIAGNCNCDNGYDGKYCQCEKSKKLQCVEPGKSSTSICNGRGECDCDQRYQCKCSTGYEGLYCDVCKSNCPDKKQSGTRCEDPQLQKCARCYIKLDLKLDAKPDQCKQLCDMSLKNMSSSSTMRDDASELIPRKVLNKAVLSEKIGSICTVKINATCHTEFKYDYERNPHGEVSLVMYYTGDGIFCDAEPKVLWIVIGVILSVLLAGILALLIWKLATHLHDTREYKRFEKATKHPGWGGGQNPLYKDPTTATANPAYRQ